MVDERPSRSIIGLENGQDLGAILRLGGTNGPVSTLLTLRDFRFPPGGRSSPQRVGGRGPIGMARALIRIGLASAGRGTSSPTRTYPNFLRSSQPMRKMILSAVV